jgi:hypothetical protein
MNLRVAAIGLLGKKWRAKAAVNEKIFIRIAYHAFCLQEVGLQVVYLLVEFGRTKKMFDVQTKYEILLNQNLGYRDKIQNITGSADYIP